MNEIFENLYDMTAFSNIIAEPQFLIMYAIAFVLLYLGIKKQYEPLLLVPIAFGVLLANFPGGDMGVIQADENGMVMVNGVLKNIWEMPLHDIAHELGIMNFIYYMLIKTGFLPPIIFMGVGALTDFGPMLRNLHLSIFGAAAQLGIFTVLLVAILMGFTPQEAASLGIIGGADGPTAIFTTIKLAPHLLGPIAIAAYSYMALVPVIIPLAVAAKKSFIAKSASMTVHPVRTTGLTLGVPQTFEYFQRMQDRITTFVAENSNITKDRYNQLVLNTGELVMDIGTTLEGEEAVEEGLIDEVGTVSDAIDALYDLIKENKGSKPKSAKSRSKKQEK